MDDMLRDLNEALLKELECPVCMQYMVPPIKFCTNGHNICSKCKESIQCCPTCRASFSEIRIVTLENIVRRQKYPCANRQNGCLELFAIEHIAEHHAVCAYAKMKCPFNVIETCFWNGFKNDLKGHAIVAHRIFNEPTFVSFSLESAVVILSHFGELFTHYKKKTDGRYYCAVQLIGTSSQASKYKCEFTLRAANGIEQMSKTLFVQGYSEDWETIFNSENCLKLDEDTVKPFVVDNKLNLTVTLSTV